ncbi:hypothetical protein IQ260_00580 [Leptolyngbya cf. ectocarpi LEGE 11479]|uniref:Uncharacterized protein n=1 Tax=Leptolyngbya cf. ectocarpi LEGE 11479 TaxID=1828722 RepID=A0A928X1A3_LEPEC|nr:hypothetical protein [Leptolyngbya ectocarpi]MBE9065148.1 hypothetical protein [Leptolyngbya cf. ectocarpi LEGE 11479]
MGKQMQVDSLAMYVTLLAAAHREQRFYQLRFMWTAIAAFEEMGLPADRLEELRGLYQGFAEGVLFDQHINSQQKGADPESPPQS